MKTDSELAALCSALAHPWRVAILRNLLAHTADGRQFGQLSKDLQISPSTLTHHLNEMEAAGVLTREPEGRATRLRLNLPILTGAVQQLTQLCCPAATAPQNEAAECRA